MENLTSPSSIKMSTERLRKNVGLLSEQEVVQYMQELEEIIIGGKRVPKQTAEAQMYILSLHCINRFKMTLSDLEAKNSRIKAVWYCEFCGKAMLEEDYHFCDICDDCRDK